MNFFLFWVYFCLTIVAYTFTNPISVHSMTIENSQIYHITSNSTTITFWIVKNGYNNLRPCYYTVGDLNCTELILPTKLPYDSVTQIRERYEAKYDVTAYLFGGSLGEICFKYPNTVRCETSFNSGETVSFRFNFGPTILHIFSSVTYRDSRSVLQKHISVSQDLIETVSICEILFSDVQDLFYQDGGITVFSYDQASLGRPALKIQRFYDAGGQLELLIEDFVQTDAGLQDYFNNKYFFKKQGDVIYAISYAGIFEFEYLNGPQRYSSLSKQVFNFQVYDMQVIQKIGYIVNSQGLMTFSFVDGVVVQSDVLEISKPVYTIIKKIQGIDAFMLLEKGTDLVQFYQFQNFQNDLKPLFQVKADQQQDRLQDPDQMEDPDQQQDPDEESDPDEDQELDEQEKQQETAQDSSLEQVCLQSSQFGCTVFCKSSCLQCSVSANNCSLCKSLYYLNEENDCVLSSMASVLVGSSSVLNLFRPQKIQQLFFFAENVNNYNFHKTEYVGFFKDTLMLIGSVQNEIWSLLPFDGIKYWMGKSFPIRSYSAYTSVKFQEMQRSDSLFFQNTKQYFLVYIPITIIMFIVFNRLFYIFSHLEISKYLRIFSFFLYALFLVIFQNWQQLLVISISHLFNIFSFDFSTKMIQFGCLFIISFIFILCISIFPMFYYFYSKQSTYFLSNVKFTDYSWVIMGLQFVLAPGLETVIHICLSQNPGVQKILLFGNGVLFIGIYFVLFLKLDIFTSKGIFVIELVIRSLLSFFNFILYLRYDYFEDDEIGGVFDIMIESLLYCFVISIGLHGVYPILDLIGRKIGERMKDGGGEGLGEGQIMEGGCV